MTIEEMLIQHIKNYLADEMWKYEACYLDKVDLEIILKALEQEPNTGHWIDADGDNAICSCCNRLNRMYGLYCKHCGARMESEE